MAGFVVETNGEANRGYDFSLSGLEAAGFGNLTLQMHFEVKMKSLAMTVLNNSPLTPSPGA